MGLTTKTSDRNADARAVLEHMYRCHARGGGGQVIEDFGRDDDNELGMTRHRRLDAADRLVERGLLERVGQTDYCIAARGVDVFEDPDALDAELPILRDVPAVPAPEVRSASSHVSAALADAEAAIARGEPASAIDRVHTALHGRVRELCATHAIALPKDAPLPAAYSALCSNHPSSANMRADGERILRSLGAVVEALNMLRNRASLAHPGELPDDVDALLAISAARTVAQYVEARFSR